MHPARFCLFACPFIQVALARPIIFWQPDQVAPGNAVLLYGGGLSGVSAAKVWRLADVSGKPDSTPLVVPASTTAAEPIQPSEESVKFILPDSLKPGP